MGQDILLVAACALIDVDGRVLLAKRPPGRPLAGLWEFPGGKVEPGETPDAALIRELEEELAIRVTPNCLEPFTFEIDQQRAHARRWHVRRRHDVAMR